MRYYAEVRLLVVLAMPAWGCAQIAGPERAQRQPIVSWVDLDLDERIEFLSPTTARIVLGYSFVDAQKWGLPPRFERTYLVSCSERRVEYLRRALLALAGVGIDGEGGSATRPALTVYARGRPAASFILERWVTIAHPMWRGVLDECRAVASWDFATAVFRREVAETYAGAGANAYASMEYERACRELVAGRRRLWEENGNAWIEDSTLALNEVLGIAGPGRFGKAVEACRKCWSDLSDEIRVEDHGSYQSLEIRVPFSIAQPASTEATSRSPSERTPHKMR